MLLELSDEFSSWSQGIRSKIAQLKWKTTNDLSHLPDFETQARRRRFRVIANEAIEKRTQHVFLGHHQDDQIETVMMRLIRNSSDSFLGRQGISEHSAIPCCDEKRAAQVVEQYERFEDWLRRMSPSRSDLSILEARDLNHGKVVTPSQAGGIQLHRPLLEIPKSDIIDFCKENNIIYVQDETNFDPTLTLRNAVRYLRSNYVLPRALQGPSILEIQRNARHCLRSLAARAELLLQKLNIDVLDLRSGRMVVCLPPDFQHTCAQDPEAAAYALARLTSVVSPCPRDEHATLVTERNLEEFLKRNEKGGRAQMTMQQVLLDKEQSDVTGYRSNTNSDVERLYRDDDSSGEASTGHGTVWTLSRQPMRSREVESATIGFIPSFKWSFHHPGKPSGWRLVPAEDKKEGIWSQWMLWDHRYWMRIRTKSAERMCQIRLRTYTEADVRNVHKQLGGERYEIQAMLAEAAPGKSRFTVPVLTVDDQVSVFPTLNVMVQKPNPWKSKSILDLHPILEWEVCYKVIDHPFIKRQSNTIKWRNSQLKHGSPPTKYP